MACGSSCALRSCECSSELRSNATTSAEKPSGTWPRLVANCTSIQVEKPGTPSAGGRVRPPRRVGRSGLYEVEGRQPQHTSCSCSMSVPAKRQLQVRERLDLAKDTPN
eukprot:scaffold78685_cov63-Phaeocystis_antarctica.AAC.1